MNWLQKSLSVIRINFHHNELELAGTYLYLCTQTGLYRIRKQALRKVQNFQMQKEDSLSF